MTITHSRDVSLLDMFKLVHYEAHAVAKWPVGILREFFLILGVFMAPVPGIYLLTVYNRTFGPMHGTMFIKVNDQILCHAGIGDQATWNTASCTGIAELNNSHSHKQPGLLREGANLLFDQIFLKTARK